MDGRFNIGYLFLEAKRKWIIIVITGVVLALLFSFRYVKAIEAQNNSMQYASSCTVQIEPTVLESDAYKFKVNGERNIAILTSDAVVKQAVKQLSDSEVNEELVKKSIYCNSLGEGDVVKLTVFSSNQETANAICKAVELATKDTLNDESTKITIIRSTMDIGPASVQIEKKANEPEKNNIIISSVPLAVVSTMGLVKKSIMGFVAGAVLSFLAICALYFIRHRAIYVGELEDASIKVFGCVGKNKNIDTNNIVSKLLLKESNNKKYALIKYGNDIDLSGAIKGIEKEFGKTINCVDVIDSELMNDRELCKRINETNCEYTVVVGEDAKRRPVYNLVSKYVDKTVLLIKRNTVKIEEVANELQLLGETCEGVVFVE